ncbi:MAG: hypothetical protein ILNGONEN_00381 [Syntrophorhabdaceae bacterium]|nr:hypothetical protein [Syntrophorhabdaceae bacterium]
MKGSRRISASIRGGEGRDTADYFPESKKAEEGMHRDPTLSQDHIYYNASYTNDDPDNLAQAVARIADTRNQSIIRDPSVWHLSVIRFDTSASTIPISIPPMLFPNAKSGITFCGVYLTYLGVSHPQSVNFTSQTNSQALLVNPDIPPGIFNYQQWLDDINAAFAAAFAAIAVPPALARPPLFILDPVTKLIRLFVDQNYIPSLVANPIKISFNEPLYQYLSNFELVSYNYTPGTLALTYDIIINDNNTQLMPPVGAARAGLPLSVQSLPVNLYQIQQTSPGLFRWSSIRSLFLTTTLIPIRADYTPTTVTSADNYNSSTSRPILTDFLFPESDDPSQDHGIVSYLPTAEYRLVDMGSTTALSSLDFQFYWTDFSGNIYPLYLKRGESMNVKILFRKRVGELSEK